MIITRKTSVFTMKRNSFRALNLHIIYITIRLACKGLYTLTKTTENERNARLVLSFQCIPYGKRPLLADNKKIMAAAWSNCAMCLRSFTSLKTTFSKKFYWIYSAVGQFGIKMKQLWQFNTFMVTFFDYSNFCLLTIKPLVDNTEHAEKIMWEDNSSNILKQILYNEIPWQWSVIKIINFIN